MRATSSARRWRRALAICSTLLAIGAVGAFASPALATVPDNQPQASCYDFYYWDGLDSQYLANDCASATADPNLPDSSVYNTYAASNSDASTAFQRGVNDAVFYSVGHSFDVSVQVPAGQGGIQGWPSNRSVSAVMAGMLFLRVVDR
jgi:hypothetical protein